MGFSSQNSYQLFYACYDFTTPSRQSALIMMSQTLARKAKKEHHRKGGALLFDLVVQKCNSKYWMKHRLTAIWSTRYARMMRLLRKHEAKRTLTFPCGKATLHRAKPCFTSCFATRFMHRQVRFIEKSTCRSKCFFLAPRTGLEPVTSWLTVMRSAI